MMAATRLGQWRRLGLPKLVHEPMDSDDEPIVNPPPMVDITTKTGSTAELSLNTSSPQPPVTNTYKRRPRAPSTVPQSALEAGSTETQWDMPSPSLPPSAKLGHKFPALTPSPRRPSTRHRINSSPSGPITTSKEHSTPSSNYDVPKSPSTGHASKALVFDK